MPKFSVVIPCYSEFTAMQQASGGHIHNRSKAIQRAIKSIINQQYPDWELIIVDDGCADGITPAILDKFAESDERIKVFHKENQNRAIARNYGMDRATGEWICWLDSDDEYSTHYLRELNQAIKDFPEYSIFNFGSILYWPDHKSTIREAFKPVEEGDGHEYFKAGGIGSGSFIFKRELWNSDPKYRIPDAESPFEFAAQSKFDMRYTPDHPDYDDIELPDTAFTDGKMRQGLSLGNPWGDDFLQFYYLTRDHKSKPLDVLLYIQYPRAHEDIYEDFGEIYETD